MISAAGEHTGFPRVRGDVPTGGYHSSVGGGFPRVRGDVPFWQLDARGEDQFSPRARGCSLDKPHTRVRNHVFPACAGMFLGEAYRGV